MPAAKKPKRPGKSADRPNKNPAGNEPDGQEISFRHHRLTEEPDQAAPWLEGDPEPAQPDDSSAGSAPAASPDDVLGVFDDEERVPDGKQVTEELESIYESDQEETEDMSRLDRGRGLGWRRLLVGLVVFFGFLALVSWAGFFLFSPSGHKFTGDGVQVSVEGPPQVNSGQLVKYAVKVKNGESVPLGTASLDIRLPKELTVKKIEPYDYDKRSWNLGSLSPGQERSFTVTGIFLAPLETQLDLQAILNYRPADFNSQFQKVATRTVGVSGSVFDVSMTGPARVLPGDQVDLDISYLNVTDNEFSDLVVQVTWPTGFIPDSAEPEATDEQMDEWRVSSLPANAEGHVKVSGSFASDAKGQAKFGLALGLTGDQGSFDLQKQSDFTLDVVEGELVVSLVLNGKSTDQPVAFGDLLHYSISWRNTGQSTLDDVSLTAAIAAKPAAGLVDWNGLRDDREGEITENRLTWDKDQVSALEHVAAGEEGTIDFDLPLANGPLVGVADATYEVTASTEAKIGSIDGQEVNRTVQTPPLKAVVSSDARFSAEARWFSGDGLPVGAGPLPPTVGQPTTYQVNWTVSNTLHDLSDLKISARLPDNVLWTGKSTVDAGELTFDAAAGKIVWTLNWLPTDVQTLKVSFDLAITPTADQQGKSPTLIDAAILEARDKANNNPIILSSPPLTTALGDDPMSAGKGKVE